MEVHARDSKNFRFGGGEVLHSIMKVKFPGRLAGRDVMFKSHVVKSNIPLLWSRPAMSRAGTILELPKNRAKILGQWVTLNLTAVGHYALNLLATSQEKVDECLVTLHTDAKEKKVNCDHKEARKIVFNIHEHCATCR